MKEFIKKNFAVVLAFALPVVLIAIVALSTYLPSLFLSTNYNFVYTSCVDTTNYYPYRCDSYLQKLYSVVDDKLVVNTISPTLDSNDNKIPDVEENYTARIFFHDTEKNESREITLKEAQELTLSNLLTSPDGVTVSGEYDRGEYFFPFGGGGSSYGYYLKKGKSKDRINLINNTDRYYYQNNFQFLGWVMPGRN